MMMMMSKNQLVAKALKLTSKATLHEDSMHDADDEMAY